MIKIDFNVEIADLMTKSNSVSELPATMEQAVSEFDQSTTEASPQAVWRALRFQAAGCRLAISIDGVVELIRMPVYTRVPNVQPWLLGVSNVRGHLLPLFDLTRFFSGHHRAVEEQRRLLIVEYRGQMSGLVVDRFDGMRDCMLIDSPASVAQLPASLRRFVLGQAQSEGQLWQRFDAEELLDCTAFTDVSVYNETIFE